MNILFLSAWHPCPPDNGSKIRVYHLLRALALRHRVTLVSFAFDSALPADTAPFAHLCEEVYTLPQCPFQRSRIERATRFLSPVPISSLAVPAMSALLQRVFAEHVYEVAIASTETMATYVAAFRGVRVLEEHNSMSRWMQDRYLAQQSSIARLRCWVSWQKTRLYEARLFRSFDLVTMVSEQDRVVSQSLRDSSQAPVEVIPNGVDCDLYQPNTVPKRPNSLVYSGALTYSANYDAMRHFLREVYPRIRAQFDEVSLTITGSTQGVALDALALDPSVVLSGYVEDIRPVVGGSTVCVVPLREGGGTRLKILEAMALGTPVVSTHKGAEGLDVTDREHLLLADSPAEFATCVLRLLRDAPLRHRLAENARLLVERRYDWGAIGERFAGLVEQAFERNRRDHG